MDSGTKLLILALVSVGSLFWGVYDLMRRREDTSTAIRIQSWAQVAAGLIGLGFMISYLAR